MLCHQTIRWPQKLAQANFGAKGESQKNNAVVILFGEEWLLHIKSLALKFLQIFLFVAQIKHGTPLASLSANHPSHIPYFFLCGITFFYFWQVEIFMGSNISPYSYLLPSNKVFLRQCSEFFKKMSRKKWADHWYSLEIPHKAFK